MTKNTRNTGLGADNPNYKPVPQDRDYSAFDEAKTKPVPADAPFVAPTERDLGTSATITLLSHPDNWLVDAGDASFSYQGDVHTYLTENGVTDITEAEPTS